MTVPSPPSDRSHLDRIQIALIALPIVAVASLVGGVIWHTRARPAGTAAPSWEVGPAPCREDPTLHVNRPTRLVVISRCSTVAGTVRDVVYRGTDGNTEITVRPDAAFRRFLPASNHDLLRVEILPRDLAGVTLPKAGDHARFSGTWALNRERDHSAELHPAWYIATGDSGPAAVRPAPSGVNLDAPASVPAGGRLRLGVTVNRPAAPRQRAGVRILLEFVPSGSRAVRWRLATTNRVGRADVDLVALDPPGSYTVWAYASDGGETGSATASYEVTRTRAGAGA